MGYERLWRGEGTHSFFVYELRMWDGVIYGGVWK